MISVLIPTYNSEIYITDAIKSVLNQSYQNFEVIVVDDGSEDRTRQMVESFGPRVQYYYQQNAGPGAARNQCVNLSKGDFLAFLDADDIWARKKLECQIQEFKQDSTLDAVFGMVRQVHQKDWEQQVNEAEVSESKLMNGYIQSTMLIKRSSFFDVGMFTEETILGDFVDWLLRAKEAKLKMKLLPQLFLWRRIHQTNLGILHRNELKDYLKILKKSIDRRKIN